MAWPLPTTIQVLSHAATLYSMCTFAVLVQPVWLVSGSSIEFDLVVGFWLVFVVTLFCYGCVCFMDISFKEERCPIINGFEARNCDDCGSRVTRPRVKHCQSCNFCVLDFDHHCRYLNVCIGGATYKQWFIFVVGLCALEATCAFAAVHALKFTDRFQLAATCPYAFYALLGLQAALSTAECLFLLCLLAQHVFFVWEGLTTLEYIKDQAPGFPSLPPVGWREAARKDQCHVCRDYYELLNPTDPGEVWFCSVCQGDISKAGVEFFSCVSCDNTHICLLCYRISEQMSIESVTTYRASAMKKRCELEARMRRPESRSRSGDGSGKAATMSGVSKMSSMREARTKRRSITAIVAAIEGDAGDSNRKARCFNSSCCGGTDEDGPRETEDESSGSERS